MIFMKFAAFFKNRCSEEPLWRDAFVRWLHGGWCKNFLLVKIRKTTPNDMKLGRNVVYHRKFTKQLKKIKNNDSQR